MNFNNSIVNVYKSTDLKGIPFLVLKVSVDGIYMNFYIE